MIQMLISQLKDSWQYWELWIHENQTLALQCLDTAHYLLHEGILGDCERTWVLGVVAALGQHLPSRTTMIVNKLQTLLWKHHVYLEIQAAISLLYPLSFHISRVYGADCGGDASFLKLEFEHSLTRRFWSLLWNSQCYIENQGMHFIMMFLVGFGRISSR